MVQGVECEGHVGGGCLHSAEAEALEGDEGAACIEAEEGLPLDDGMLPEPAPQPNTYMTLSCSQCDGIALPMGMGLLSSWHQCDAGTG